MGRVGILSYDSPGSEKKLVFLVLHIAIYERHAYELSKLLSGWCVIELSVLYSMLVQLVSRCIKIHSMDDPLLILIPTESLQLSQLLLRLNYSKLLIKQKQYTVYTCILRTFQNAD